VLSELTLHVNSVGDAVGTGAWRNALSPSSYSSEESNQAVTASEFMGRLRVAHPDSGRQGSLADFLQELRPKGETLEMSAQE
jgi:hypothetical protein